jgi:hypothetical protein
MTKESSKRFKSCLVFIGGAGAYFVGLLFIMILSASIDWMSDPRLDECLVRLICVYDFQWNQIGLLSRLNARPAALISITLNALICGLATLTLVRGLPWAKRALRRPRRKPSAFEVVMRSQE